MRFVIAVSLLALLSCSDRQQAAPSGRDTLLGQYLRTMDSLSFSDTLNSSFRLLRSHYRNDTVALREALDKARHLLKIRGEGSWSTLCESEPRLDPNAWQEAYQFQYRSATCPESINITLGRRGDSLKVVTLVYTSTSGGTCIEVRRSERTVKEGDWRLLQLGLAYADFWSLAERSLTATNGASNLVVAGFPVPGGTERVKKIYRQDAEHTGIGEAFKAALVISGDAYDCTELQ